MSHAEWFATAKAEILARPNPPPVEIIDEVGSTYNNVCHGIAAAADEVEWLVQTLVEGLFLDLAQGDALSRLGSDRYGVTRHGATSALVTLRLERPTDDAGAVTVEAGSIARTDSGIRFRLSGDVGFPTGAETPAFILAVALEPGPSGNVAAGTITRWETELPDDTITVTNVERAAGGNVEESDEDYRARVRAAFLAARRATLEAIRQGALAVPEVREAAAYEVLDPEGNPAGAVILTVADASGAANQELLDAVMLIEREYRAAGIGVFPQGATVRIERIKLRIRWRPNMATVARARAVVAAVIAAVNRLDPRGAPVDAECEPGALLTVGLIQAAARTIAGVLDVDVIEPVGTVVPDPGEVFRTDLPYVEVVA